MRYISGFIAGALISHYGFRTDIPQLLLHDLKMAALSKVVKGLSPLEPFTEKLTGRKFEWVYGAQNSSGKK